MTKPLSEQLMRTLVNVTGKWNNILYFKMLDFDDGAAIISTEVPQHIVDNVEVGDRLWVKATTMTFEPIPFIQYTSWELIDPKDKYVF